jgi:hypothetical protein
VLSDYLDSRHTENSRFDLRFFARITVNRFSAKSSG